MPALLIVMSHLVEIVFVQLSHEAGKIAMLEMLWEDRLGESLVLHDQSDTTTLARLPGFGRTSNTTKLPPSSPQRTTCE